MALNKEQKKVTNLKDGVYAVIAVPGSGKTETMMERIGLLVNKHKISPEEILGLTFTRNAAEEMRSRLIPILGEDSHRVTLSTVHSFCHYLLRNEGRLFNILSGKEQIIFIKDIMKKLKIKELSMGMILKEISLAKNNLILIDEFRALYEGDKTMLLVADIYEKADQEKAKKMLMTFDDLLIETYKILKHEEGIKEKYQDIFKHLMVDEFQDTSPLQMEVLKLLIGEHENKRGASFMVFGDDWQNIYSFTGASVGNILNFKTIFPASKQHLLTLNYRSTPQILKGCQNLIDHNVKQIDKTLKTNNKDGDEIIVLEEADESMEALAIVSEIEHLVSSKKYEYKDIAILYRANFQSRVIEEAFLQNKIPYYIESSLNFYLRTEIKNLLNYLRLIQNPETDEGDEALLNILNIPNRYLGKKFKEELKCYAFEEGVSMYHALKTMRIDPPYIRDNVNKFIQLIEPLIEDKDNLTPTEILSFIREEIQYDKFISDQDMQAVDDVKIQNLNQLQLSASRFEDIKAFLEYTETFQDKAVGQNEDDGVKLMTIHKSKGCEFPVVFVIGMVAGILPSNKGNIEEERRICFVACSRAMDLLYLSYSQNYLGQPSKKSIFINEILSIKELNTPSAT